MSSFAGYIDDNGGPDFYNVAGYLVARASSNVYSEVEVRAIRISQYFQENREEAKIAVESIFGKTNSTVIFDDAPNIAGAYIPEYNNNFSFNAHELTKQPPS